MGQRGNTTWLDSGTTTIRHRRLGVAKTIRADAGSRDNKESDQPSPERGSGGSETNESAAGRTR